ncbi:hypothetical protein AAC387_Pa02g1459 [Persea americana]
MQRAVKSYRTGPFKVVIPAIIFNLIAIAVIATIVGLDATRLTLWNGKVVLTTINFIGISDKISSSGGAAMATPGILLFH